jgi:hypothetical protein
MKTHTTRLSFRKLFIALLSAGALVGTAFANSNAAPPNPSDLAIAASPITIAADQSLGVTEHDATIPLVMSAVGPAPETVVTVQSYTSSSSALKDDGGGGTTAVTFVLNLRAYSTAVDPGNCFADTITSRAAVTVCSSVNASTASIGQSSATLAVDNLTSFISQGTAAAFNGNTSTSVLEVAETGMPS